LTNLTFLGVCLLNSTAEFIRVGVGSKPGKNFVAGLFTDDGGNQSEATVGCAFLVHEKDSSGRRIRGDQEFTLIAGENREGSFYMSTIVHFFLLCGRGGSAAVLVCLRIIHIRRCFC
jgi:hypothetical protein